MSDNYNKNETAIELYRRGYREKKLDKNMPQSKVFFLKLRSAIIQELESMGFCELADSILDDGRGRLDIIVFSAFADIANGYEKNKLTDVENDMKFREYVPYIKGGLGGYGVYSWSECMWIEQHYILLNDGSLSTIRRARQVVRMKHKEVVLRDRSREEKAQMLMNAQEEAHHMMEESRREADRMIHESRLEAERILESAQRSANNMIQDANSKANEKAKESSDRLIERYLAAEQKQFKEELNEELRRHTAGILESSKRAATTHTEMCNATNALQVKWVQALDDALSQMTAVKAEFYAHIHDWQVSLFPSEIRPLAERYLELYRIINVDKLLRETILFKNKTADGSTSTENLAGTEAIAVSKEECPDTVIMGLQRLNKTLTTFLRRFEVALNGLDLYVFYPNVGDEFDDMWHIPDDEDEEYHGKRIKECVVPGIAKKANDNCGDDVLIPAVVRVEMES